MRRANYMFRTLKLHEQFARKYIEELPRAGVEVAHL